MRRKPHVDPTSDELHNIVNNLVSGVPLSRVPEELHSRLLVPLSAAKNEAIVAGNAPAVKCLQSLMHELQLTPGKSPRPISRADSPFVTGRWLRDEQYGDLQATIDELLDGRLLETLDCSVLESLIPALKERKQQVIAMGNYQQSQQLENLIQEANSRYYEATYHSHQNERLTNLRVQLLKAREDLDTAEQLWREAKDQHDEEYSTSLRNLEEQQRQQLGDFDASFPEILPANFRKLSPQVLQLRNQERHLVLSKRYQDAIPVRERADRLENEELERQRIKFERAFETQRQQLVDTQLSQRRCFDRNWERKFERFQKESQHEMSVLKRTIANFETKIATIEGDTEMATGPSVAQNRTPRGTSRTSVFPRPTPRQSPAAVNPRVRNVAATAMTQKKCVVKRMS
jgi:hypothetical protein